MYYLQESHSSLGSAPSHLDWFYQIGNGAILGTNYRTSNLHRYLHSINQGKQFPTAYPDSLSSN